MPEEQETEKREETTEGAGRCKLCDCPKFIPSSGGQTCINRNSQGGTCNHYGATEHY